MLHFDRMILTNFGPYKGEQTIDFTDKPGVTIVWGNNGRGKTILLNAFRYALFGIIQRRNGNLKNLNEMENTEASSEGKYGFSVVLEMTNDGDNYRLTRQLKLREGITKPKSDEDYERVAFLEKNGSILSPQDQKHELSVIMPEQVSRFFLFDAELLQEYEDLLEVDTSDGEEIKEAIEKILGVPVLTNSVIDIADILSTLEKQKTRAVKSDNKTNKLGQELEEVDANINEHESIIEERRSDLSDQIKAKNRLEEQMKQTDKIRKWITDRDNAQDNVKQLKEEMTRTSSEIKQLMSTAWKGMLLSTIRDIREEIGKKQKILESKRQKGTVAESFIREMKRAIANRVCPVCGQKVSSDIIDHLKNEIKMSTSQYSGLSEVERKKLDELHDQMSTINILSHNVKDEAPRVEALEKEEKKIRIRLIDLQSRITEDNENIKRNSVDESEANIRQIAEDYGQALQTMHDLKNGIDAEKQKLKKYNIEKQKISKKIDKASIGTNYKEINDKYNLCKHLYNIFDESKSKYREQLKKNVEKDATDIFVRLTSDKDYVGLKINDNYGLEIIHKSGRTVPGRSSGYEHIVALSLIGALHKNAPLRGPIIIDSPFGRLDPHHKENVIKTLPSMAEQIILLAYEGEIDKQMVRNKLRSHLINEFYLKRISSMHTQISY